jgi:uncharacterized damage-inducible protein DinB
MFSKTQFEILYAYHWSIRRRLLKCAAQVSPEDYRKQPGYGRGSIHDLFLHLLSAERLWRLGLELGKQLPPLDSEEFPGLEAIQAGAAGEQAAWELLLESLSAAEIEAEMSLTDRRGRQWNMPRWRILQHVILHGMQHHTELAQLLTAAGQSPGDIDFIFYR